MMLEIVYIVYYYVVEAEIKNQNMYLQIKMFVYLYVLL